MKLAPTSFDLDLIIPEYMRPSGFFGALGGACIWQNTVYNLSRIIFHEFHEFFHVR